MPSTLTSPIVASLLQRLFSEEDLQHEQLVERSREYREPVVASQVSSADFKDMYLAVDSQVGTLLYSLVRSTRATTVVEFGTSFGLSSIYLASALQDNGGGAVITSEIEREKVEAAQANFAAAGLSDLIEVRIGNVLDTFKELPNDIDLAFLDGWPDLYLQVLKLIEPHLRKGALVIADYLPPESFIDSTELKPYREYVTDPENGYIAVDLAIGDTISIALRSD